MTIPGRRYMTHFLVPHRTVHDETIDILHSQLFQARSDALIDLVLSTSPRFVGKRLRQVLSVDRSELGLDVERGTGDAMRRFEFRDGLSDQIFSGIYFNEKNQLTSPDDRERESMAHL